MPYKLYSYKKGYRVCKKTTPTKCFSKKALTYIKALSQMRAIILSELRRG